MNQRFVITDELSLDQFSDHIATFLERGAYQLIEVAVPSLEQRELLERRINRHYRACGCLEGGIAVLLSIAGVLVWHLVLAGKPVLTWPVIALDVGTVFLAALVGKAFGMVRARIALRRTLKMLSSALAGQIVRGGSP